MHVSSLGTRIRSLQPIAPRATHTQMHGNPHTNAWHVYMLPGSRTRSGAQQREPTAARRCEVDQGWTLTGRQARHVRADLHAPSNQPRVGNEPQLCFRNLLSGRRYQDAMMCMTHHGLCLAFHSASVDDDEDLAHAAYSHLSQHKYAIRPCPSHIALQRVLACAEHDPIPLQRILASAECDPDA